MSLQGKTALVTAAGQGIGRASAVAGAGRPRRAGHRNRYRRQGGRESGRRNRWHHRGKRLDVTDADAVTALVSASAPIDIVVNCAVWVHDGTILDCKESDWDRAFELNAKAMFRITKAVLPGMLERKAGSIVNIASVVSSLKGAPRRFAYGSSKAAIIGLTKAIAADFVKDGIRCNAVCPVTVESPSLKERLAATGDYDRAYETFTARQPKGRFGTPMEIAEMVCYLAGDLSAFTTGQAFAVDGGWST